MVMPGGCVINPVWEIIKMIGILAFAIFGLWAFIMIIPIIPSLIPWHTADYNEHPGMDWNGFVTGFTGSGMAQNKITHDAYFINNSINGTLHLTGSSGPADSSMPYGYSYAFTDKNNTTETAHVWVGQEGNWIGNVEYNANYG